MINSFYSISELQEFGFASIGDNVKISRFARFYGAENISIGNNVRIDDFCLLSGKITLKNNIHISAYCALYGGGEIEMDNYSGLSPRCTLLSATDDFSGEYLIGPQNPSKYTKVLKGKIQINKYCQLGASTVVFPYVEIGEGTVTGAMSLVRKSLPEWGIFAGNPIKNIGTRRQDLLRYTT